MVIIPLKRTFANRSQSAAMKIPFDLRCHTHNLIHGELSSIKLKDTSRSQPTLVMGQRTDCYLSQEMESSVARQADYLTVIQIIARYRKNQDVPGWGHPVQEHANTARLNHVSSVLNHVTLDSAIISLCVSIESASHRIPPTVICVLGHIRSDGSHCLPGANKHYRIREKLPTYHETAN